MYTKEGSKNHKDEPIIKIYPEPCPICNEDMIYFEAMFSINPRNGNGDSEMEKLIAIQELDILIEKIKKGDRVMIYGFCLACPQCYMTYKKNNNKGVKKPYIMLDSEDLFKISNVPISHVYLAQRI